ncbi:DASH complex subunit ask1 [Mortierella polycephala]|uniref:DASH complex subunit ASK1 n=1 Tax=Mortierella polycephala TaxID=41804 RepID=A0A9P6PNK8_9FUNG|nr:DASH complex subunit ask1 [Mortierella polycephala]
MSSEEQMTTEEALEEIERLDQTITRTLQDIDQSFSNCHMIVATKILPQIDRYAEASADVWKFARIWLDFLEACSAPPAPRAVGRRVQALREAREKAAAAAAQGTFSIDPAYSSAYRDGEHIGYEDQDGNITNRPKIHRPPSGILSNIQDSSPMLSTPTTPSRKGPSHPDLSTAGLTTPTRPRYSYGDHTQGSTTPTMTPNSRVLSVPRYTQAASTPPRQPAFARAASTTNVDEDHQDVITPPSTLQFSVPESKLPSTPKSVVAKSLVDRIKMKDGLVVPQPIFVNDDEEEDREVIERYTGGETESADAATKEASGIGGSKKRSRDGDILDEEEGDTSLNRRSRSWASLTDEQRNRERLLKSPRKVASVRDFFASASTTSAKGTSTARRLSFSIGGDDDGEEEDGQLSPSRRLMSQIQAQAEEDEVDPLLAALTTPPDFKETIMRYRAKEALAQKMVPTPDALKSTATSSTTLASTLVPTSAPAPAPAPSAATLALTSASSTVSASSVATTASTVQSSSSLKAANRSSLLTAAPSSNISASTESPAVRNARAAIDSIFKQSFTSGFASASDRRQTMATPTFDSSRNHFHVGSSGDNNNDKGFAFGPGRNSVGPGFFRSGSQMTSTPFGNVSNRRSSNSQASVLGSSILRKPLYGMSPSPASRAAASAIASATTASVAAAPSTLTSSRASRSLSKQPESSPHQSPATQSGGLRRLSQPAGMGIGWFAAGISGPGVSRQSATSIVSTANFLTEGQEEDQPTISTTTGSASKSNRTQTSDSDYSSRGFSTPFSNRVPPPAPRLGYNSDTIMTQSSLGLNHDGFGGYDSEERTRMTMSSERSHGTGGATIPSAEAFTSNVSITTTGTNLGARFNTAGRDGDQEDGEDDDDIMRSPCPPGKNFFGSKTDLMSIAEVAATSTSKSGSDSSSGPGSGTASSTNGQSSASSRGSTLSKRL